MDAAAAAAAAAQLGDMRNSVIDYVRACRIIHQTAANFSTAAAADLMIGRYLPERTLRFSGWMVLRPAPTLFENACSTTLSSLHLTSQFYSLSLE